MLALLNDQPILVLMATVALGAAVGTIPTSATGWPCSRASAWPCSPT